MILKGSLLNKCFICLVSECRLLIVILRSNSSKSKAETSPKTPSSPSSPTFAPSICLLAPCYLTGDSVRDKCVEMLSAALKADGERAWARDGEGRASRGPMRCGLSRCQGSGSGCCSPRSKQASLPRSCLADACVLQSLLDDYKDYGVNCDKMASEIEDHILELCQGCGCLDCPAASRGDPGQ